MMNRGRGFGGGDQGPMMGRGLEAFQHLSPEQQSRVIERLRTIMKENRSRD
jgi:hypothetical protein